MWDFVSGWAAGMVGITVGYPFDTIKVNQQTQGLGTFRCTQIIYQQFGVKGFFRGLSFPLAASGAINSLYFGVYRVSLNGLVDLDRRYLHSFSHSQLNIDSPPRSTPHMFHALAGCATGVCHGFVLTPVELIKIKLQSARPLPGGLFGTAASTGADSAPVLKQLGSGPIAVFRDILDTQGVRGMYKGLFPTMCRSVPGAGVYMFSYESLSSFARSRSTSESMKVVGVFVAGGISGMIAWWAVMPIDTIKSIIQADDIRNPRYTGMLDCARHVWREQGVAGFGRGFWAVGVRAFPVNGSIFLTLEGFNYLFRDVMKL